MQRVATFQEEGLPDSNHFQQRLKTLKSALDNVKNNVTMMKGGTQSFAQAAGSTFVNTQQSNQGRTINFEEFERTFSDRNNMS